MSSSLNVIAQEFKSLHKPGRPVLLANVYDAVSAKAVAQIPETKALATASYAVAAAAGLADNDLDMETNLRAATAIAGVAKQFNKPLTVDFQDGYGDRLEDGIERLIQLGVVGINLEDVNNATGQMYAVEEAAARVKRAVQAAASHGVPDFVVNARVDSFIYGGSVEEAVKRGHAYLAAGAANIFVWGGRVRGGISRDEVVQLARAYDGKLNVSIKITPGNLTVKDVAKIGVARCSIGPALQFEAADTFTKAARKYLDGSN